MAGLSPNEFTAWARLVEELCGVRLAAGKEYLIETRLGELMRQQGCANFGELYYRVRADATKALSRSVIDLMTTNETSFFRDGSPFEMLRHKILPDILDRRNAAGTPATSPIRIWSMACSTGQEIYTIAMLLDEMLGGHRQQAVRMVGTDISNKAVSQASRGIFNTIEMERGLPPQLRQRYFTQTESGWKINDRLRAQVTFRHLNLLEDFSYMGTFDVLLCRNVAIYFAEAVRKSLFDRIERHMGADSVLIIGSTESITGICPQYQPHRHVRSVYYTRR